MAAHSRPSKIINPNEAVFTPVQNSDPVGSFASEPFTLPKSPFNPRIRPSDEFCFTLHRLSDTIRLRRTFSLSGGFVRQFGKREHKSGGCDVVPDLSRSESAVTQQSVRKPFRIRTYNKPPGGRGGLSIAHFAPSSILSRRVAITSRQSRKSAVQPAIFAV